MTADSSQPDSRLRSETQAILDMQETGEYNRLGPMVLTPERLAALDEMWPTTQELTYTQRVLTRRRNEAMALLVTAEHRETVATMVFRWMGDEESMTAGQVADDILHFMALQVFEPLMQYGTNEGIERVRTDLREATRRLTETLHCDVHHYLHAPTDAEEFIPCGIDLTAIAHRNPALATCVACRTYALDLASGKTHG